MMDIIIQNDGFITPFNILTSKETRFTILPQTRDAIDELEIGDGDIDFGTGLAMGEFNLHGIIEFNSIEQRNTIEQEIKKQFNNCRTPKTIAYECSPEKFNVIRLTGKPEITRYPFHLEVRAQFKTYPYWQSTDEHLLTGSGTIANNGTLETGLIIEITGSVVNPIVVVGDKTLTYSGSISSGKTLVIDTCTKTAKIGTINAIANYNNVFPILEPGSVNVSAGSNVKIKWRDRWI